MQCKHHVSSEEDVVLAAVLGSCIAVCAFDETAKVGGMNHILLPGGKSNASNEQGSMYGINLMELLLNDLFKRGARRGRLQLKLFGGAKLFDTGLDAGARNIEFISEFVANENLEVSASSLGGNLGRQVEFQPVTGRSRQRFISDHKDDILVTPPKSSSGETGEVEFF